MDTDNILEIFKAVMRYLMTKMLLDVQFFIRHSAQVYLAGS